MKTHPCRRHLSPRTPSRNGFTLVEVLVVISIIAVLVAMLIPALGRSRDSARAIICRGNLRQLAAGFEAYASSWKDYIPASAVDTSARCWVDSLGEAEVIGPSVTYTGYNVSYSLTCKSWMLYKCPSEVPYMGVGDPSTSLYIGTGAIAGINYTRFQWMYYRTSYQINWEISKYSYGVPRKGWSRGPELMSPALATLVADGQAYYVFYLDEIDHSSAYWDYPRTKHAYRHYEDQLNVLYFDGHVTGNRPYAVTGEKIWPGYLYNNAP